MRRALPGLLLLAALAPGCGSPSRGPVDGDSRPHPAPPRPVDPLLAPPWVLPPAAPRLRSTSPLAERMVDLLLEYRAGDSARPLEEVRDLLEHPPHFKLTEQPIGYDQPGMPGVRYLAAFAARLQGDEEGERAILAPLRPEDRAAYDYLYGRPEEEVFADLRCAAVSFCLEGRGEPEDLSILRSFAGLPGAERGLEQVASCGAQRASPASCSELYPVFWRSFLYRGLRDALAGLNPGPRFEQFVELAGLRPGMVVADIGAGEGFYSFRMAEVVGERGRVYAEEISPQLVRYIAYRAEHAGYSNVLPVLGEPDHIPIPAGSADRVLLSLVVFDFEDLLSRLPAEEARRERHRFYWELLGLLAPGGNLVVLEHSGKKIDWHGKASFLSFRASPAWQELRSLGMEPLRFVPKFSSNVDLYVFGRRGEAPGGAG